MSKKVTFSVIKADVGSIGGHTCPTNRMLESVTAKLYLAQQHGTLIDYKVTHTGDDIALLMSHTKGEDSSEIHELAWDCFMNATKVAKEQGLYGAGQDLLVDAPSGNVRGAGPAVAEIEFVRDNKSKHRPAEAFMVFAADKCGPGAYNLPFYSNFADPMHNTGLLLKPEMKKGWTVTVMDMDHTDGDRMIDLVLPEQIWDLATLLSNIDRYAIHTIRSRHRPDEVVLRASTSRLHNISGKYSGKDDPIAVVRTQGIFPAPEELVHPWLIGHRVTGDCRGSHVMPIMPVPINTPVSGAYCLPIVSALAISMDEMGRFSHAVQDMFVGMEWGHTRLKIQAKAEEGRREGFFGSNLAPQAELAYTGIVDAHRALDPKFYVVKPAVETEAAPDSSPVTLAPVSVATAADDSDETS
jgi:fructose 1,6-bisphosphate aldolase/phosphatase